MSKLESNLQTETATRSSRWLTPAEVDELPVGTFLLAKLGEAEEPVILEPVNLGYAAYGKKSFMTPAGSVVAPFSHKVYPVTGTKYMHAKFRILTRPAMARWAQFIGPVAKKIGMESGTDPEFFVRDSKGEILPAFEFLPAAPGAGAGYWDGYQAEFQAQHYGCLDRLNVNIQTHINNLQGQAMHKDPGARITHESVVEIPELSRLQAKDEHVRLGCSPSLNAYGSEGLEVRDGRLLPIRFAGGHMHFGLTSNFTGLNEYHIPSGSKAADVVYANEIVKTLDATVGLMGVSMAEGYDDPRRRQYYGLAGEYRLPTHGLEYRVMSNFMFTTPQLVYFFYDMARMAVNLGWQDWRKRAILADEDNVQSAINNCDAKLARKIIQANEGFWMKLLAQKYGHVFGEKKSFQAIMEGPGVVKIDPSRVVDNWQKITNWATTVKNAS